MNLIGIQNEGKIVDHLPLFEAILMYMIGMQRSEIVYLDFGNLNKREPGKIYIICAQRK